MSITRVCTVTGESFEITDEDLAFYEKIGMPPPTLCPEERRRRRLVFRNDRKLYKRICDLCKKPIIATYEQNAPFPVYCNSCWWSDKWDAASYGRDFNFNRGFFEQWHELNSAVPHIALWQIQNENSEYTHDSSYNKDCYMLFGADYNRNCYYSWNIVLSKDCCDCAGVLKGEQLYEGTDCIESQFNYYCQLIRNCSNCYFCFDLVNCHNCFGSSGLRNKTYYWYNEPLTPEEYKKRFAATAFTPESIWNMIQKSHEVSLSIPRKYVIQKNCEDCTGSYLGHCKNVKESFDMEEIRDARYSIICYQGKDIWDCEILFYNTEVCYESHTLIKNCFRVFFSWFLRDVKEVFYSNECYSSQNLFGCVGLRQKKYAVFNKVYAPGEYNALIERIIAHMKKTGEFGEFFPISMAPFAYNESAAYDYILPSWTKEETIQHDYRWSQISDAPDSVINEALTCTRCNKNYMTTKQELMFYRANKLPVPAACFDCRHHSRLLRRGPRRLFDRACDKCGASIRTIYAVDRPEKVYCEKCYLESVY